MVPEGRRLEVARREPGLGLVQERRALGPNEEGG